MRALVIGSGAREHALAWAFSRSTRLSDLYIAPGNAGTEALGTNLGDLDPLDFASVVEACKAHRIDAVVVGPEDPLAAGLVDRLAAAAIPVFGPPMRAAQLEASKLFSKEFMQRHRIPDGGGRDGHRPAGSRGRHRASARQGGAQAGRACRRERRACLGGQAGAARLWPRGAGQGRCCSSRSSSKATSSRSSCSWTARTSRCCPRAPTSRRRARTTRAPTRAAWARSAPCPGWRAPRSTRSRAAS